VTGSLLAALVLVATAGAPRPAGVAVTGVPAEGVHGTVKTQAARGDGIVLGVNGVEIRITPWPEPGTPPELVGMTLVARPFAHPEGPAQRIELGPAKGPVRWTIGSGTYPMSGVVDRFTLGRPAAEKPGDARVPILDKGKVLAHLGAGGAMVLRDGNARWCLRILAVSIPSPPPPGVDAVDAPREARIDFVVRRQQRKSESCRAM
jgi:hypothetical protein